MERTDCPVKVSFVVWDGLIGGAERQSAALAAEFQRQGVQTAIVFVGGHDQLRGQLERDSVQSHHLGMPRGGNILLHPRHLARVVHAQGADAAIVAGFGYLGTLLRLGGFRRVIIGVEHGDRRTGLRRACDRAAAVVTHDAEITISAYMESLTRRTIHSRSLVRIPHGVLLPEPGLDPPHLAHGATLRLGYAGRLYPGKGVDALLRAVALCLRDGMPVRLAVAGDGPSRDPLVRLAAKLGIASHVRFAGWTDDISSFWAEQHLAVAPNDCFVESFCVSIAEAMAHSRPAIVTSLGALPELVERNRSGAIVPPGNPAALAAAIQTYARQPDTLASHGAAAKARAQERFSLRVCAQRYLRLLAQLEQSRRSRRLRSCRMGSRQLGGARSDPAGPGV